MSDYYIEIPKRKKDIELPRLVTLNKRSRERFCYVTCSDENNEFFEYWMESNGISYQRESDETGYENKKKKDNDIKGYKKGREE